MRDNWNLSLIRAAMGVHGTGAYLASSAGRANMKAQVETIINNAVNAGVYVLVDWHSETAHLEQADALAFFADLSARYGDLPNVLFETFNEPLNVSWTATLKPYIRLRYRRSATTIQMVGPTWSSWARPTGIRMPTLRLPRHWTVSI